MFWYFLISHVGLEEQIVFQLGVSVAHSSFPIDIGILCSTSFRNPAKLPESLSHCPPARNPRIIGFTRETRAKGDDRTPP